MDSITPSKDTAAARALMVDGQVRPNKVSDARILEAMRKLPRERFLPAALAPLAYADADVKMPGGRALIEPMVIARLAQSLMVRPGETVLVIGAGAGYGACLLAACGGRVTALEEEPALLALARAVLPEVAPGVAVVEGSLATGWKTAAPYDAILIEGAVEEVPEVIAAQVKRPEGRLVTVRYTLGRMGQAVIGEAVTDVGGRVSLGFQPLFDCATTPLSQFRREVGFVF